MKSGDGWKRPGRAELEETGKSCEWCTSPLEYAAFAFALLEGVMGGTGFVGPPEKAEWALFCSRQCVVEYLSSGMVETANRFRPRMP